MATKEQERKALERIRQIVAELGEYSYIGTAFEGCFELAEENIENNFALSMKSRAEKAEKETEKVRRLAEETRAGWERAVKDLADLRAAYSRRLDGLEQLKDRNSELKLQMESSQDAARNCEGFKELCKKKDAEIARLQERVKQVERERDGLSKTCLQHWDKFVKEERRAEKAEAEVIKLKAKLYDALLGEDA